MCPSSTRLNKNIVIHTCQTQSIALINPSNSTALMQLENKLHKPTDNRRNFRKMTSSEH